MTLSDPDPYYYVQVNIGHGANGPTYLGWILERDPAGPPPVPDYGLADPLIVSWAVPQSDLLYAQPEPFSGSFSLIVESMSDLAGLAIGDWTHIEVYGWPPGSGPDPASGNPYMPIVQVSGSVAAVTAVPHELGMFVTVVWVDHQVELSETTIGAVAWPAENATARIARISTELGLPATLDFSGLSVPPVALAARTASPVNARQYLVDLLDRAISSTSATDARAYLGNAYNTVGDSYPSAQRFYAGATNMRIQYAAGEQPAELGLLSSGKYGIVIDTAPTTPVARWLDACDVLFDATYELNKSDRVDTYSIQGTYPAGVVEVVVREAGAVPVLGSVSTELTDVADAIRLGSANLNGQDSDGWKADSFTLLAYRDPLKLLHPRHLFRDDWSTVRELTSYPVAITGIDPDQNPTGETWFAGQITGADFVLSGGRYSVGFTIRRNLPRPLAETTPPLGGYLKAGSAALTMKYNQLDPSMSYFDARLLRSVY